MNLLIDIGNTRLKWGMTHAGRLIIGRALVNQQLKRGDLIELWKAISPPQRLAIACVSANWLADLVQSIAIELWPGVEIMLVKSAPQGFGVHNAYRQPEKLGVDRWLALIAARHYYRLPACIVDCGTAITVDFIDVGGFHQGGLICPGLTLMKKSLAQNTEALHFFATDRDDTSQIFGLANFTEAAIDSGTLFAACGLIEYVIKKQAMPVQIIITGGDAGLVARQLDTPSITDADLVLRGLTVVLEDKL